MGDSDEEAEEEEVLASLEDTPEVEDHDSGFVSFSNATTVAGPSNLAPTNLARSRMSVHPQGRARSSTRAQKIRHSAPSMFNSFTLSKPDYKLLHQTHVRLHNRFLSSSYTMYPLQKPGVPGSAHTNTIYCLQLYTYPETGKQVLFTGSRDKTVREWNMSTGLVERVIGGVHSTLR